jgi:ketosteroid isomerase-like protein
MTGTEARNLEIVTRFLRAVEGGATGDTLRAFFTEDVVQEELPNRLVPRGIKRDLGAILASAEKGREVVRGQRYDVRRAVAQGDSVILEVDWTGTLAVPYGSLAPGDEMRAHIAFFIELRGGRIASQREYGCFEPF